MNRSPKRGVLLSRVLLTVLLFGLGVSFLHAKDDPPAGPTLTFTPANAATNVAVNATLQIAFSAPIRNVDNSAITSANVASLLAFKLTNAAGADVPFTAVINAGMDQITVTPTSTMQSSQLYYLNMAVVEDASDNATTATAITFTTADVVAPVLTFTPTNSATNVSVSANLTIALSEPIRNIDDSPITNANVGSLLTLKLTNAAGADVPFTATINATKDLITIDPTSNLNGSQVYYLNFASVEDASNNATSASSITFTTVAVDTTPPVITFTPANASVNVSVSANLTIAFDEPIRNLDNSAITNGNVASLLTFKLTNAAGANVPFTATINGTNDLITIDPTSDLIGSQLYYLSLAKVEDGSDNATAITTITFTTIDATPPVITFNPANSATFVSTNANIIISFDEAIRNTDNSAINNGNVSSLITLKVGNSGGANVPFTATINGGLTQITIDPNSTLAGNQQYFVELAKVEDVSDNQTSIANITFTTSILNLTPPSALSACSSSGFVPLGDIILEEKAVDDFNDAGGNKTITLGFDQSSGFVFQSGSGTFAVEAVTSGTDLTFVSMTVSLTTITITYSADAVPDKLDRIRISGVRVSGDATVAMTNIIRTGGSASLIGITGSSIFGTINSAASPATPTGTNLTLNACQGDVISLGPNITGNNSNVKWYTDATLNTHIAGLDGVTNINSASLNTTLGFVTSAPGTITRYVAQNPGTCQSSGLMVTLTIQQGLTADLLVTTGSSTACYNWKDGAYSLQPLTFTATPTGANTYTFKVNGSPKQTGASNMYSPTAFANGDVVTVDIAKTGYCTTTAGPINMTINKALDPVNFVLKYPPLSSSDSSMNFSNATDTVQFNGTPAGGTFSGIAIVNNYFNPKTAGVGGPYVISYTYTNASGCTSVKTRDVTVEDGSVAITGLPNSFCSSDAPVSLSASSRPGYTLIYAYSPEYYAKPIMQDGFPAANSITAGPSQNINVSSGHVFEWAIGGQTPFTIHPDKLAKLPQTSFGSGIVKVVISAAYTNNSTGLYEFHDQTVTVAVQPPAPIITNGTAFCTTPDISASVLNVSNLNTTATVHWYKASNLTQEITAIAAKDAPTLTELQVTNHAVGTYVRYLTQTLAGCQSPPLTVTIDVSGNPSNPAVNLTSPVYCSGGTPANELVTANVGAIVKWYDASNALLPMANPKSASYIDLKVNTKNLTASPIDYIFHVTQTISAGACESDPTPVTIRINPVPDAPVPQNNDPTFCQFTNFSSVNPIVITSGSNVKYYKDAALSMQYAVANGNLPTAAELGIDSSTPGATIFYVTQTLNTCESAYIKDPTGSAPLKVTITPLESVTYNAITDGLCRTGDKIKLTAKPAGGDWSGSGTVGLTNVVKLAGTAEFDPTLATVSPGQTYTLTYTSPGTCSNSFSAPVNILPSIAANPLIVGTSCANFFTDLENTSVIISTNPTTSTIASVAWTFGDGTNLNDSVPSAVVVDPRQNSKGTYTKLSHRFRQTGSNPVHYVMTTSDKCVVDGVTNVTVNPVPVIDFAWMNACEGSATAFSAVSTNGVSIASNGYSWNFNKSSALTYSNPIGINTSNPSVEYTKLGRDSVSLVATSAGGCRDTVQKAVFIVPFAPKIKKDAQYLQDFNADNGGWVAGGIKSSWEYGKPDASNVAINRDSSATGLTSAWKTKLLGNYNPGEKSWVLSPCFDFSESEKPVISLDIFSDTPKGADGAVLQYCISSNIADDANWINVGVPLSGINWYEIVGVNSNPGNQAVSPKGWTGDASTDYAKYHGWVHASYALDFLAGSSSPVKFRIAFAGTVGGKEGFAFDNVSIGERSRLVLLENFTNSSAASGAIAHAQNVVYNSFHQNTTEVVKIEYHTSFPGPDPINARDKEIYDARVSFYGITAPQNGAEAPAARLDGSSKDGNFVNWGVGAFDDRNLLPSPVTILPTLVKDPVTGFVHINVKLKIADNAIVPRDSYLQTVIVENKITDPALLGNNADTEFDYVARQMLPSAAGLRIPKALIGGNTYTLPDSLIWKKNESATPVSIVIFLQNNTLTDQSIYQSIRLTGADVTETPSPTSVITGVEPADGDLQVYPNPSNKEFVIKLAQAVDKQIGVRLFNSMGQPVSVAAFELGEQTKRINTDTLPDGVYILQIGDQGTPIRKKVIIVH